MGSGEGAGWRTDYGRRTGEIQSGSGGLIGTNSNGRAGADTSVVNPGDKNYLRVQSGGRHAPVHLLEF